ncbi:MAG: esterase family protein [Solobacterium sp.]|nr:esterase family protein [Solobacterium sp.]
MKTEYYKEYSSNLGRDMEFKVYGHAGKPMLVFPCQDGMFFDFEDRGMVAAASQYIDSGRLQLFCCGSNDQNSWSRLNDWDNRDRILQQEAYYHYIVDELVPRIFSINAESNGGYYAEGILTTGCSMGGTHALNFLLRRPDIFAGCIAMSGAYNARLFFPNYSDDLVYANSPVDYIDGMPYDHPYVEMYRHRDIIIVCGRGAWEHPMQEDAARMKELFAYKNIPAWVDFWGNDVAHDWPWWLKEFPYYLNFVC